MANNSGKLLIINSTYCDENKYLTNRGQRRPRLPHRYPHYCEADVGEDDGGSEVEN